MFNLLFKLTASVCMLALLAFIALVAWFMGQDFARDYAESRAYANLTCGQFADDLSSGNPARANHAIELYTAPTRNIFVKRSYTPAQFQALPGLRPLLETCLKQRAYTLPQAVRVTIETNVGQRAAEVMRTVAIPGLMPAPVAQTPAEDTVSATTVSATETVSGTEEAAPSPTQPKPAKPAKK